MEGLEAGGYHPTFLGPVIKLLVLRGKRPREKELAEGWAGEGKEERRGQELREELWFGR